MNKKQPKTDLALELLLYVLVAIAFMFVGYESLTALAEYVPSQHLTVEEYSAQVNERNYKF